VVYHDFDMDFMIASEMIGVIKTERQVRSDRIKYVDQDIAYDRSVADEVFINDMCLMVLVALHHQIERELVFLAARADVRPTITDQEYQKNVVGLRKKMGRRDGSGWKEVTEKLELESFAEWKTSMETLRLVANCLKHEPTLEPDQKLLEHLNLAPKPVEPRIVSYSSLPESSLFREGLARSVSLPKDADYCTIAETFVDFAKRFFGKIGKQISLAQITGGFSVREFSG
jgi:hypothetical protein